MDEGLLLALLRVFLPLSLLSIGGIATIIAEMEHQTTAQGWLTQRDFIDIFAIARVSPGPGTVMVTMIGWKVAGWMGALIASLAIYLPTSLLVGGASVLWRRHRAAAWRTKIERGLAPIATGLIFAGAYAILNATGGGPGAFATAAVSTGLLLWRPLNPFLLLCGGAAVYAVLYAAG